MKIFKVQNNSATNGLLLGVVYIVDANINRQTGVFYTFKNVKGVFDSDDFKAVGA